MKNITIKARSKDYRVFFSDDLKFIKTLKKLNGIWVIDRIVYNLYKKQLKDIGSNSIILFDAREDKKTVDGATFIYRALTDRNMRRNRPLISLGGGITQDVTGFVASTFYRGIRWIFVPTTLLAQADSCIGSKTSLNFDSFKNLLGTFYAPEEVYISTKFLDSLDLKDWYSGFGEIVKLQLIKTRTRKDLISVIKSLDQNAVKLLELIYDSLLVKKKYIEKDEFDYGQRRILNYGHCFGHALESVSKFAIPHGLAVVAGMLFANIIALKRNQLEKKLFDTLLQKIFLPHLHAEYFDFKNVFFDFQLLFNCVKKDKKRTGKGAALVLPKKNFELELIQDLSWKEFQYGCKYLKKKLNQFIR